MPHEPVLALVVGIVALLLIAAAAAIGVRRVHVPYVVGLVVVGIALGLLVERVEGLEPLRSLTLTPEVIVFIFLPTLIFEAAFNLDSRLLSRNLAPVLMLAAPGLLISTLVAGGLVAALTPLSIGPALLFGALISATDPVAVIALFKEIGAPKRLGILVEGESLFNDAAAIVLFKIILAVLIAGAFGAETVGQGVLDFIVVFGGGVLVGGLIGYLMIRSIALAQDDPLIEVTLSTVVAYAAFIVAEHYLEVSGVMATVGAGVVIGAYGSTRFTPEVKAYLRQFWEYAAFVANSLIFLLVGLSVDLGTLTNHLAPIGWAIAAVLVARAVSVFGLVPALRVIPGTEPIGWRYQTILFWGGLRGAVALALALSLPAAFPERDLILALTIGVVLFTLFSGGLTIQRVMHHLGLDRPTLVEQVGAAQATVAAKREALDRIGFARRDRHFSGQMVKELEAERRAQVASAEEELATFLNECQSRADTLHRVLATEGLAVEAHAYRHLYEHSVISEPVLRELELTVELRRDALNREQRGQPGQPGQRGQRGRRERSAHEMPMVVPLELRLGEWIFAILRRIAPRSRVVMNHKLKVIAAEYEHDTAVLRASEKVGSEIGRLAELTRAGPAATAECRQVYDRFGSEALARLEQFETRFPGIASAVQRRTVERIALDAEAAAIERLAAVGGIPQKVAAKARRSVKDAQRELASRWTQALQRAVSDEGAGR